MLNIVTVKQMWISTLLGIRICLMSPTPPSVSAPSRQVLPPSWQIFFFRLTVVYGPWEDPCKEAFLQELLNLKPPQDTPWLCIGDFNLIHSAADKNNLSLNRRLMGRFRSTLDTCELLELTLHNRKFTWSNGQLRPTLIQLHVGPLSFISLQSRKATPERPFQIWAFLDKNPRFLSSGGRGLE